MSKKCISTSETPHGSPSRSCFNSPCTAPHPTAITLTSSQASQKCSPPPPHPLPPSLPNDLNSRTSQLKSLPMEAPATVVRYWKIILMVFNVLFLYTSSLSLTVTLKCLSLESKVLKPEDPLFPRVEIILWPRV